MVRVAGLFDQLDAGIDARGPDGLAPSEQIDAIQSHVLELDRRLHACFGGELRPALEEHGIRIVSLETASAEERREIDRRFHEQVFPALTPLVIGLGRPFPYISNLSLSLGVLLRDPESGVEIIARVKVPKELLGRFLPVGEDGKTFVPARGGDRRQPRRALPRHRGDRLRLLPGHPRRRLQRLRRGRRPAAGGPGRAPPPPLRRGRAAGDRRRDEPEAARAADRRAAPRRPRGLRRRRADRPRRPRRDRRRPRPRRAALLALDAGHPAAPAGRGRRAGRHVRGDPPAATCSSTTPTTPSPPRSSASSSRRSTTPTCWRSSRRCTGPATTRRWCRR